MTNFLSLLAYRCLLLLLLPFLLIFLLIRSVNHPEYRHRLSERLGFLPNSLRGGGIIVHAASVGEVLALKTFIEKLLTAYPGLAITVTTFTPTGSAQVKKLFGDRVQHCYFPLDIVFCSGLFLRRLKPKALVVMETELWPNITYQAARKNIKLLLINGRLSATSGRRYQKLTSLITPCINRFDKILCQSSDNQVNFIKLGALAEKCLVSGNLKFDITPNNDVSAKKQELEQYLNTDRPVWLFASTHPGDEDIALKTFQQTLKNQPDLLLVLVPRHPERFDQVAQLCQKQGLNLLRRTEKQKVTANIQVWLLDTLGELMPTFSLATLVTMGGSFSQIGGHNPLEPALFKKPVTVGPDMSNFTEIFQQLSTEQGILQLDKSSDYSTRLSQLVLSLLKDKEQAQRLGENAYRVVLANQGASQRTLEQLQALLR